MNVIKLGQTKLSHGWKCRKGDGCGVCSRGGVRGSVHPVDHATFTFQLGVGWYTQWQKVGGFGVKMRDEDGRV